MIYFLDNSLQLQKIVTSKNVISAIHEHELNGLIRADVELDLSYANKFLILGIDHVGYYYKDEFYLHKIQRVEYDHVNETVKVVLRHIFFEDMIFGKLIQDVRPQNQDALTVSRQTIDANTRWQTIMTDVTGRLSTNFYWQVPYEVIEFMTENYRIEYIPKILFDGQNINGFQLYLANKIGVDKNIRIPYGSRVLDLKYEEDYSEIITKLVVHGKGEEVGDGYGRRINISDVNFSRNGVESPVGSLYLEDESITNTYGNDGQTPREGREVFEDIENVNELAEAGYQHYLQVSRPQMLFTADVADIGDVGIGDSVMIIRREYDVYFKARIHKLSVDLLYPEDAQVELGDYKHFKESKIARKSREKNNQLHKRNQSEIERLKRQFDENFNAEVEQLKKEFEQAKIDIFAEIEADRVNMEALLNTKLTEFNTEFNADMDAAYEEAQRNYTAIEGYVNTTVDTNRSQVEQIINTAEQSAKEYASQQAIEKANAVQTNLDTVTGSHAGMLQALENSVIDIDDFLGDVRGVTLDELFLESTLNMEERIRNIRVNTYNMLKGTRFDEPGKYSNSGGTTLLTDQSINRLRITNNETINTSSFMFSDPVKIEPNVNHWLVVEYFSFSTTELDYLQLQLGDGSYQTLRNADTGEEGFMNLQSDGNWRKAVIRINSPITLEGRLRMGSRWNRGTAGIWIDVRQPYLTNTSNREWLPHPNDATQSIEMITRRMTELEDGYSDFITKSQYDLETGSLNQYIRSVEQNVEGNELVLQRVEDWQATNGQSVLESVDAYRRKLWLNDFSEIGANMIPQSLSAFTDGRYWSTGTHSDYPQDIRLKREQAIVIGTGVQVTFSDSSTADSGISHWLINMVDWTNQTTHGEQLMVSRGQKITFVTQSTRVLLSAVAVEGSIISQNTIEQPNKRIFAKLEVGASATPMLNAISHIEQLANKISMQVQDLDGEYLSQSDIEIRPGYVQLGSQRLGDNQLASIFRVSPNSIDAITERMVLNGDLYVDGDITALAVTAIKAEFADLFAARVRAGSVHADYVEGFAGRFESLYTLNANIERLVSQHVFTDAVTTKSLDAIVANIGKVRTAFLKSNVIESDHIQVGTALVDKLFATSARIDELITKSHFVTNVKAMSIEAVEGQFSTLFTRYLSANYIDVDYVNGKNAWFEYQYTLNANIAKLTAQTAFIRDIQTIEVTANQLNINTLHNKLRGVEGGLTIYGYDGRVLINNSILENTFAINFIQPHFMGVGVTTSGNYFKTTNTSYTTAAAFSYLRGGRYLTIEGYCEMRSDVSGSANTTVGAIRLMEYSSGTRSAFTIIESRKTNGGDNQFFRIRLDLGVPQYEQRNFYVQFYTAHSGNAAHFRINQAYYHG